MSRDKVESTAFIAFVGQLKQLSNSRINCKVLYGLVGRGDSYFNHRNPTVRKRSAGELSRIVHTGRYIDDMQARYNQNNLAFEKAAEQLTRIIGSSSSENLSCAVSVLTGPFASSIIDCLEEEKRHFRSEIDMLRAKIELQSMILHIGQLRAEGVGDADLLPELIESYLHLIAFGCLESRLAQRLLESVSKESTYESLARTADGETACLIRMGERDGADYEGTSAVGTEKPFTIGRYTTCDVIEIQPSVSLLHAVVYKKSGRWWFEDMESELGSKVFRADKALVYDSAVDGSRVPCELQFGDSIELAQGAVLYRFARLKAIREP